MPTFRVTGGALSGVMMSGNYPDNTLPEGPDGPIDPGWGNRPPMGGTLPEQPPGAWPPLSPSVPIGPAHPIAGVPVPPGAIWPPPGHVSGGFPVGPGHPAAPLPPSPGHPDAGLPAQPGHPDTGLPPSPGHPSNGLPHAVFWMIAYAPNLGWKFVSVDPSLVVGMPLPPAPEPK